jgi:hypothetical protein
MLEAISVIEAAIPAANAAERLREMAVRYPRTMVTPTW